METEVTVPRKRMFDFLPAIYQDAEWRPSPNVKTAQECPICGQAETHRDRKNHLGEFLEAFEKVLLGFDDYGQSPRSSAPPEGLDRFMGLGQKIELLYELVDPEAAPARFLPWLASLAALNLRPGMSEKRQRRLIAQIIPLYRKRGTKEYLDKLLTLCLDVPSSVSEEETPPMQLGVHHQIGVDTYIGGSPPHFFTVTLNTGGLDASSVEAQRQIAYEVIELAKPAHTTYELAFASPSMRIGIHSTIGQDTVLSPPAA